jgi:hypothetical protein
VPTTLSRGNCQALRSERTALPATSTPYRSTEAIGKGLCILRPNKAEHREVAVIAAQQYPILEHAILLSRPDRRGPAQLKVSGVRRSMRIPRYAAVFSAAEAVRPEQPEAGRCYCYLRRKPSGSRRSRGLAPSRLAPSRPGRWAPSRPG